MHRIRVLRPAANIFAFYDGRIDGYRFAEGPNWVDDGALSLGISSYAVVDDVEALIYDTHVSVEHARFIRKALEAQGVRVFTVVLSHWHLDHVAGTAAFRDSEVVASKRTAELLAHNKAAIEDGSHAGLPPIDPLILPTRVFLEREHLDIGRLHVELIQADTHSDDATVIRLAQQRLLLCGDRWRTRSPMSLNRRVSRRTSPISTGLAAHSRSHPSQPWRSGCHRRGWLLKRPDPRDTAVHPRAQALPR